MNTLTRILLSIILCVNFIGEIVYAGHTSTKTENIFTKGYCVKAELDGIHQDIPLGECASYTFERLPTTGDLPSCSWNAPEIEQIDDIWWWIQISQEVAGVNPDTHEYDCDFSWTSGTLYDHWEHKWGIFERVCLKPFKYSESAKACIVYCPPEKPIFDENLGQCVGNISQVQQCDARSGNPIDTYRGEKVQKFIDFSQKTSLPLAFIRSYKSQRAEEPRRETYKKIKTSNWKKIIQPSSYTGPKVSFYKGSENNKQGHIQWRHNYQISLSEYNNGENVAIELADGKVRRFIFLGGGYVPYFRNADSLTKEDNQWRYIAKNTQQFIFSLTGKLLKIEDGNGQSLSFTYGTNEKLSKVTNIHNETLQYFYNENLLLSEVKLPDTNRILYKYDEGNNLISVIYPDDTVNDLSDNPTENYVYDDTFRLLSIRDKKGIDYASWQYNSAGQAMSSHHIGGVDAISVNYDPINKTSTVMSANGKTKKITFRSNGRIERVVGDSCSTSGIQSEMTFTYDNNGRVKTKTDENGIMEVIRYNVQGFILNKTKSFYTENEQKTSFEYDAVYLKPTKITYANGLVEITEYGNAGRIESHTLMDGTHNRMTRYYYNVDGLLTSVDGPRTDVDDIYSYEYDDNNYLKKITNPLNQSIQLGSYNAFGQATQITDENGVLTELTFDINGRLIQSKKEERISTYQYDILGQITQVSLNGLQINYKYNDARRLIAITDNAGNSIKLSYDLMGNVTQRDIEGNDKVIKLTQKSAYDILNRVSKTTNALGQSWINEYDVAGSLIKKIYPNNTQVENTFDTLNRATESLDQAKSATKFEYNKLDQLTKLTDALGRSTEYEYNKFGDLIKQISPDTGITSFTYDSAGNMLSKTDERKVTTSYQYDALNRISAIMYAHISDNINFSYDALSLESEVNHFSIGRLSKVTELTGDKTYYYNAYGEIVKEITIIDSHSSITEYSYNFQGKQKSITYPSGRVISYNFNVLGQVSQVSSAFNGAMQTLASNIEYLPFGPMKRLTYGNAKTLNQIYDKNYQLNQKQISGILDKSYAYTNLNSG
ncbi:DUF6531 domain-containing protein [Pseudoalteromonas denitrificans]|uniref:YD repeat-containing protein n=1 Tax=Pseudoalteromonas denitrificans DSM 6059 TaxID=1123010 RepID=A0A1I1F0V6_9GAMM|nr:DUF6531 domain-containing protein [Pseudoalteromonas denitrificans]SFB92901.1 YD repeat-containing protein [Pseudoalteromonas denitrificans DSM 6059]